MIGGFLLRDWISRLRNVQWIKALLRAAQGSFFRFYTSLEQAQTRVKRKKHRPMDSAFIRVGEFTSEK